MSKNRRKNRARPHNAPSQRRSNGQGVTPRINLGPDLSGTETTNVWITPGVAAETPPVTEPDGAERDDAAVGGSRFNSVVEGLRSRLCFPPVMKLIIDLLIEGYCAQMKPQGQLQRWLVSQCARATAQIDVCDEKLLLDTQRVIRKADNDWNGLCRERTLKLAGKISLKPHLIQPELQETKHGALFLIEKLTALSESVQSNSGLDEPQVAFLQDLIGLDRVLRNGSRKLPASDDAPALQAFLAKEIARHRANIERTLEARCELERNMVQVEIVKQPDAETRNLRSDRARLERRFKWAWRTFHEVRRGEAPDVIMDPETHQPVDIHSEMRAAPPRKAAPAAPTPPTPPPPPEPEAWPADATPESTPTPPLPEGFSEAHAFNLGMIIEARYREEAAARAARLSSDGPSGEPGPPSA